MCKYADVQIKLKYNMPEHRLFTYNIPSAYLHICNLHIRTFLICTSAHLTSVLACIPVTLIRAFTYNGHPGDFEQVVQLE